SYKNTLPSERYRSPCASMRRVRRPSKWNHMCSPITLGPAEFFHGQPSMPYLGHVDDLVTFELHDIDVVGARLTSRRRNRTARASMSAMENAVGSNVVPRFVDSE